MRITAAFTVKLHEKSLFSYLDVTRITVRIDYVILVESEAMDILAGAEIHPISEKYEFKNRFFFFFF